VLLVEDNPVNALVAEAELQRLGVHVTVLNNGRQALDWLACQAADLVLMDCEMPEMDGIEATRRIREHERTSGKPPVTIVALTANGLDTYAERCVDAGMNDHLSKPFRPEELEQTLSRHLRLVVPQR
jgi:CheY-like chemotaxis protein